MNHKQLLAELETAPHSTRMQRMVELGSTARSQPTGDAARIIDEWERGGFGERMLALQTCYGSGNGALVLRMLADPSRRLRGMALRLVALVCSDEEVLAALGSAMLPMRQCLLQRLHQRKRGGPIDTFVNVLAERNDAQIAQLLPYASPPVVQRLLPRMLQRAGAADWRRLARFHPDIAGTALQTDAAAVGQFDLRLVAQAQAVVPQLARRDADAALALVNVLRRYIPLRQLALDHLLAVRPREVTTLLLASDDRVPMRLDGSVHRLDDAQVQALLTRQIGGLSVSPRWFRRLPPAQRAALYATFALGWRNADGVIDAALVALLPRALREAEGRRHLTLPVLATRPAQRLPYAAFVPWDEAVTVLAPFIRNPDAQLRASAGQALVGVARYDRNHLGDVLAWVRVRRHEQDPVRLALLGALAALPPSRWRADHLDDLGQIIHDALDAADLSYATARAAEMLVVALLPFHPAWSAAWLATLAQARGMINVGSIEQRVTDEHMRRLVPALLPVLQAWATREREGQLVATAQSFGRRLPLFPQLLALLERIAADTRNAWTAERALQLVGEHAPDQMARLVPMLLRADRSTITLSTVHVYLHRRRQDLLTPFLGQAAYRGRFSTGKTRFVLPFEDGFQRWTATQQRVFAGTLTQLTHDEQRDSPALLRAINQLAALPSIDPTRLTQLADVRNPRLVTRDAALRALGRLDAGQGVPILLDAMGDDRARVAIYVLRRAMLALPPARALALLETLPLTKVTVAKEVVRLLGDLHTDEAYAALLRFDEQDLHRDVRVALLRALWEHVERPATWSIFERTATAPDPALAAGVIRIPADRMSPTAQGRLAALLSTLLQHPEARLRVDVLGRCATLPLRDDAGVLLPRFLEALQSSLPDEVSAAARAVFATYTGREVALVGKAIAAVLPNRRALHTVVEALQGTVVWQRERLLPTVRVVLDALQSDPLTVSLRVTLATAALPSNELATMLIGVATTGALHAEALMICVAALTNTRFRSDVADLGRLEATLAARPEVELRRLALAALVLGAQPPHGWDEERRVRLDAFRADPAPLVAAAAQFTVVPDA